MDALREEEGKQKYLKGRFVSRIKSEGLLIGSPLK